VSDARDMVRSSMAVPKNILAQRPNPTLVNKARLAPRPVTLFYHDIEYENHAQDLRTRQIRDTHAVPHSPVNPEYRTPKETARLLRHVSS
jgi:hypothetical protein